MKPIFVAIVFILLGGCMFMGKVSDGLQCEAAAASPYDHPLKRPKDCRYWYKHH